MNFGVRINRAHFLFTSNRLLTGGGVHELHGERLAEVVLRPDGVLPVRELGEARREEAAGVAKVDNLKS